MSDATSVLKRSLAMTVDQCNELEGRVQVLAKALADIESIASDYMDLGREDLSSILHICHTQAVKQAGAA